MMALRLLLCGGGTGGHLVPGLALVEALAPDEATGNVAWLGTDRPVERQLLATSGVTHLALHTPKLGPLLRNPLWNGPRLIRATAQAIAFARRFQPEAVVGLGGYASVPGALAARWLGCPLILLEANALPGRVTRWMQGLADAICLADKAAIARLPRARRLEVTGLPVRDAIAALANQNPARRSDGPRRLIILGGSLGAPTLNAAVVTALHRLKERLAGWSIAHQTGPEHCDAIRAAYAEAGLIAEVVPFWGDMPAQYCASDLVVCRAGGSTLAELMCAGLPSILCPWAQAADQHQLRNAQSLAARGAARLVRDDAEAADNLVRELSVLLSSTLERGRLSSTMRSLARPGAASEVLSLIHDLTRREGAVPPASARFLTAVASSRPARSKLVSSRTDAP